MLGKEIKDALKEKKHNRLTAQELLEMDDEDIENYIESLDFDDIMNLLLDVATADAPLARVISVEACQDLNEILDSDFKTVEVKDIVLFLNAIASDALNDEELFFIYGAIAMLKCMYEDKKDGTVNLLKRMKEDQRKGYKPKHAKTSTD